MKKFIKQCSVFILMSFFLGVTAVSAQEESDSIKVVDVYNDSDWHTIVNLNIEVMDKLVFSQTDINSVDLNDEEAFLELTGWNRQEYLDKVGLSKQAAQSLIANHNIQGECGTCATETPIIFTNIKEIITNFRKDTSLYTNYKKAVISLGGGLGSDGGWCCGWAFYTCTALCAATIEVFPVYLLCTSLCFKEYCCEPK